MELHSQAQTGSALIEHRGGDSTQSGAIRQLRHGEVSESASQNVGDSERLVSTVAGTGLVGYGLSRGSLLGWALSLTGAALVYRGWTGHCSLYDRLGLNSAVPRHAEVGVRAQHGRRITHACHVNREAGELYDSWRDLAKLPQVFSHLKTVEVLDEKRSRWTAHAPLGGELQWEAEIINDQPGKVIAWQSLPDSTVDTAGSVHFNASPVGGTELRVNLKYDPPGGRIIDDIAHLVGRGLGDVLEEDLRRFKQQVEAGEIATNAMQPQS